MKKYLSLVLILILTMLLTTFSAYADSKFSDVEEDDWFYSAVSAVEKKGLISGYKDGTFRPEKNVTFGEFFAMAILSTGDKDVESTREEGEHWAIDYYRHALRCYSLSYGFNTKEFKDLSAPITRAHAAAIISGILEYKFITTGNYVKASLEEIQDVNMNSKFSYAIGRVYGAGIISGYKDGTFRPDDTLTRAEAASIIWNTVDASRRVKREIVEEEVVSDSRTQEERIVEILQNGAQKISFDPVQDITKNVGGHTVMEEHKAREYMDLMLASLEFTGNKGEYYLNYEIPDMPDGFEAMCYASITYKYNLQRPVWSIHTHSPNSKTKKIIPTEGKVRVKIDSLNAIDEISYMNITFAVVDPLLVNPAASDECNYRINRVYSSENGDNFTIDRSSSLNNPNSASMLKGDAEATYNIYRHFTWE